MIEILISRRLDYALRAIIFLANQPQDDVITISQIAKNIKVSEIFLAKIFQQLAKKGIIESQRGKTGGVRFINKNSSVLDIINIIDPKFRFNECLNAEGNCFLQGSCPMHKILKEFQEEFFAKLEGTKIKNL